MTTAYGATEGQARELPGLLSTVCRRPGNARAGLDRGKARVCLRLAVAVWMVRGRRAARSGIDRRAPVPHW